MIVHAGDDVVHPSSYVPMTEYLMGSQERELLAHFSKEEEREVDEGEEDEEEGERKKEEEG